MYFLSIWNQNNSVWCKKSMSALLSLQNSFCSVNVNVIGFALNVFHHLLQSLSNAKLLSYYIKNWQCYHLHFLINFHNCWQPFFKWVNIKAWYPWHPNFNPFFKKVLFTSNFLRIITEFEIQPQSIIYAENILNTCYFPLQFSNFKTNVIHLNATKNSHIIRKMMMSANANAWLYFMSKEYFHFYENHLHLLVKLTIKSMVIKKRVSQAKITRKDVIVSIYLCFFSPYFDRVLMLLR